MTEIPFHFEYGLLYVTATVVHQEKHLVLDRCIFDTGSGGTVFDTDALATIGIHALPQSRLKRLVTVGGYQTVFVSSVDQLLIGQESLRPADIEVGNLHSRFGVQGILGTDIMRHFDWQLRFSDQILAIVSH